MKKTCYIYPATTPELVERGHPVMRELRPHLDDAAQFVATVMEQRESGYHLALLECEDAVRSAAGYRIIKNLSWGRHMYVDDLVTREADRGAGFGSMLFDWLVEEARRQDCAGVQLDSGVHRFGAHRFYLGKGMDITCHHFGLKFEP